LKVLSTGNGTIIQPGGPEIPAGVLPAVNLSILNVNWTVVPVGGD